MKRALDWICDGTPWAIRPDMLRTMHEIAQRRGDLDAVLARRGEPLENTSSVEMREGVAIIPVRGPIFPRANLFTEISGATSIELLARDFAAAESSGDVSAIILRIDSPGGRTTGINEFANLVASARKPVIAYVEDMAASAAYWIAAAADEIVLDATAMVGSIGVVASVRSFAGGEEIEIVSANAPAKRPDVATDAGRAIIQAHVDAMEAVFIDAVARFRALDRDKIIGLRGDMAIGARAVELGFADRLGSLENLISQLSQRGSKVDTQTFQSKYPDIYQAALDEGRLSAAADSRAEGFDAGVKAGAEQGLKAERDRVAAILALPEAQGRESQARICVKIGLSAEDAKEILATAPKAVISPSPAANPLAAAMAGLTNPAVGLGTETDADDEAKLAASVVAFLPKRS